MASTSNHQLCQVYSLADIKSATNNFDEGSVIGHGGFGNVYEGRINGSSTSVAIKRLDPKSKQGAPEFRAEIETLSKLRHAHLVSLLGCCDDGKEMIIVYEYMPNGTLDHHLHKSHTPLSWMQRLKIGVGAARGLDYLHTGVGTRRGIIHRDVKSSNILLDEDMEAKISDFGLAKVCPINQQSTSVDTGIKYTHGYLDPEIFVGRKFTRKTDVFAFGVVLFELLSERNAVLPEGDKDLILARWAQNCVKEKNSDQIVAAGIRGTLSPKSLKEFVQIAYCCLHFDPKQRPTMSEVVVKLQLSVALQENFVNYTKPAGLFGFTLNMLNYGFLLKKKKSVHARDGIDDKRRQISGEYSLNTASTWPAWLSAVAGDAIEDWTPRRADSFEKLDKIGEGTYSNVYKARDLMTGKIVALKRVTVDILKPENVKIMAREILILRRLEHPNIIKLEGLVTSEMSSSLYLVFEYMEHDLSSLAAGQGVKFTQPQIKCLVKQLLSGLEYCHRNYVLHRDIKGSDLRIDNNGILKIADFGSASFYDPQRKQPMTSRVVSLWYRPLELLLGATFYGAGVDMWSVGCVLAELLAGKPIMQGRTEVEQLHKIYKLCGSPSEKYYKRYRLPNATLFKPRQPYKCCITETFKDFPSSSLPLLKSLLAIDPDERISASASLNSDFFSTEPFACDPSEVINYPPNKELDVKLFKLRDGEARRRRDLILVDAEDVLTHERIDRNLKELKETPRFSCGGRESRYQLNSNMKIKELRRLSLDSNQGYTSNSASDPIGNKHPSSSVEQSVLNSKSSRKEEESKQDSTFVSTRVHKPQRAFKASHVLARIPLETAPLKQDGGDWVTQNQLFKCEPLAESWSVYDERVKRLIVSDVLGYKLAMTWPLGPHKGRILNADKLLTELCTGIDSVQNKSDVSYEDEQVINIINSNVNKRSQDLDEYCYLVLDIERLIFEDLICEAVNGQVTSLQDWPVRPHRRQSCPM
ncbi:hypothetical protein SSX86_021404 [Deinandra increscens subsp. villosa]|uniref:Protein kinase domain-containing protein n=1 Tax=Deinandra increscens subsp. villosa TaxID=3103831 RepID=A0AAP0CWP6_9ASTR